MARTYRIAIPLLLLWLLGWISISWPAIQDDALIHLRYADNLVRYHCITYNGVHRDYGASSLLYVSVLAALRLVDGSANLARATSSAVHLVLFVGLAWMLNLRLSKSAGLARLAGLVLLVLVAMPSAVRWLDDGMETGLVACAVCLLAWMTHEEKSDKEWSRWRYLSLALLAFLMVLLRTELLLACSGAFCILVVRDKGEERGIIRPALRRSHVLLGAAVALALIIVTMHVLLPDTAIAKSHGIANWFHPIHDTAVTLGGAYSFGIGMLLFWMLTMALVAIHQGKFTLSQTIANSFAPTVLGLAALRGQEIQGVRYFAWTFFFSIAWNVLQLGEPTEVRPARDGQVILCAFLALIVVDLPFEAVVMQRVLTHRGRTMREFEAEQLSLLRNRRGIASDIGYIGYFTGATICDLAGLVNGREAARVSSLERAQSCVRTDPDFVFGNISQLATLTRMADMGRWKICGRYEFTNVTTPDTHYLAVRTELASAVCSATSRLPESMDSILPPAGSR